MKLSAVVYIQGVYAVLMPTCDRYLGMDVEADSDLLYIAEWALTAPVPEGWTVHLDKQGREYFYHTGTKKSQYEHPMDQHYQEVRVIELAALPDYFTRMLACRQTTSHISPIPCTHTPAYRHTLGGVEKH